MLVHSPWTWLISELEERISSASFWAVGSTSVWWAVIKYWTSFCSWSLFIWNNVSEIGNRSFTWTTHTQKLHSALWILQVYSACFIIHQFHCVLCVLWRSLWVKVKFLICTFFFKIVFQACNEHGKKTTQKGVLVELDFSLIYIWDVSYMICSLALHSPPCFSWKCCHGAVLLLVKGQDLKC